MKTRTCSSLCIALVVGAVPLLVGWQAGYYLPQRPGEIHAAAQRALAEAKPEAKAEATLPPHTPQFKFTNLHGSEFLKDRKLCKTCHGEDLKGGLFKSACEKCHTSLADFAHFSGDITSTHGAAYLKKPQGCTFCHGADLEGSGSAVGCKTCHSYPHSGRWSLPAEHGQAFIKIFHGEDDPVGPKCDGCHAKGGEFQRKYPDRFVACDTCHVEMPHPGGVAWARGGHREIAKTYEGKCGNCHRKYTGNLPRYKECRVCHGAPDARKNWFPIMKFEKPGKTAATERPLTRALASEGPPPEEKTEPKSAWRHHGY